MGIQYYLHGNPGQVLGQASNFIASDSIKSVHIVITTKYLLYIPITCSAQMIDIVESHLLTTNSTEAWIVLNFISSKMKSREPDALLHQFITLQSVSSKCT